MAKIWIAATAAQLLQTVLSKISFARKINDFDTFEKHEALEI